MKKRWTALEDQLLRENYETKSNVELGEMFNVTKEIIAKKLQYMGLSRKKKIENLAGEEWKKIASAPKYSISIFGRVRNDDTMTEVKASIVNSSGYAAVPLMVEGRKTTKNFLLHRLVAIAFLKCPGNPDEMTVNHKKGDKTKNGKDDLEWMTIQQNNQHAFDTGLNHSGENHHLSKLSEAQVRQICDHIMAGKTNHEIAKQFNVDRAAIYNIRARKNWKRVSKDYKW